MLGMGDGAAEGDGRQPQAVCPVVRHRIADQDRLIGEGLQLSRREVAAMDSHPGKIHRGAWDMQFRRDQIARRGQVGNGWPLDQSIGIAPGIHAQA